MLGAQSSSHKLGLNPAKRAQRRVGLALVDAVAVPGALGMTYEEDGRRHGSMLQWWARRRPEVRALALFGGDYRCQPWWETTSLGCRFSRSVIVCSSRACIC